MIFRSLALVIHIEFYRVWVELQAHDFFRLQVDVAIDEVVIHDFLPGFPPAPDGSGIRSLAILNDYSVQAYAELTHPQLVVYVLPLRAPPVATSAQTVRIRLVPGPLPKFLRERLR